MPRVNALSSTWNSGFSELRLAAMAARPSSSNAAPERELGEKVTRRFGAEPLTKYSARGGQGAGDIFVIQTPGGGGFG